MGDLSLHFSAHELRCRHCFQISGLTVLGPWEEAENVAELEALRLTFNEKLAEQGLGPSSGEDIGLVPNSAYRCAEHPEEAMKQNGPGEHNRLAVDWAVQGIYAAALTAAAFDCGWTGYGWQQKGPFDRRFVHTDKGAPRSWSY